MSYTNGLDNPSLYFNTKLYTGNNSTLAVTGVGFQPDWVWIKNRDSAVDHALFDIIRGGDNRLESNTTDAEATNPDGITSFDSDGFTLSNGSSRWNGLSDYASWNWLASNTTASNTDGSITSTVSANTTSGFSIVSYTGGGSFGDTVGHGLGAVPAMIIVKTTNATSSWYIWQKAMGATDNQFMDFSTGALQTSGATIFDVSAMSSTTFTLGTNIDVNGSGSPKIAYCFAEKKGFSKFGSYTGNGSTDGTFVYTGFKPAFVLLKHSSGGTDNWNLYDNKRLGYNANYSFLIPNEPNAENTTTSTANLDILSNGFKIRASTGHSNSSGETYIYMAFASNPFVTSGGIPTTAR